MLRFITEKLVKRKNRKVRKTLILKGARNEVYIIFSLKNLNKDGIIINVSLYFIEYIDNFKLKLDDVTHTYQNFTLYFYKFLYYNMSK